MTIRDAGHVRQIDQVASTRHVEDSRSDSVGRGRVAGCPLMILTVQRAACLLVDGVQRVAFQNKQTLVTGDERNLQQRHPDRVQLQRIRLNPNMFDLVVQDLAAQYAIQTESALGAAIDGNVTVFRFALSNRSCWLLNEQETIQYVESVRRHPPVETARTTVPAWAVLPAVG
jgi:hypothetical protein